jgi:hypothetical protein
MKRPLAIFVILAVVVLVLAKVNVGSASPAGFTQSSIAAGHTAPVIKMGANQQMATATGVTRSTLSPDEASQNALGLWLTKEWTKTIHLRSTYWGLIVLIPLLFQWFRYRNLTKARQALLWRRSGLFGRAR